MLLSALSHPVWAASIHRHLSIQSRGGVSINASGHAAVRPAPACTLLHQFTKHTQSEAAGLAPRVGGDIICFHAILAQEHPGTICLSVRAAFPLHFFFFFLRVCMCVFDKGRGGEREMEREASGSCIYTCMSRSLLAGRQRNTPAA